MNIQTALQEIGLTEKEVQVYLALLKLGEETASRVSEIADLNRITTYMLLKSLQEKGFCSIYHKNKIQYFKPIKPEQILGLLDHKNARIKAIIPLLKKEEKIIEEKTDISLYEGKNGISTMFDIILKEAEKTKEILSYGNLSVSEKAIEYQSLHWRKTRLEKGIRVKGIIDSLKGVDFTKDKKWQALSKRKINKNLSKLNSYTIITNNPVGYVTLKGDLTGILIKNKEIADKERFNFDLLWKG